MLDRAEVSRRLKAGRWLFGATDDKGRPTAVTPQQLAALPPLQRNGISANAIVEFEQMIKDAKPMELAVIADTLQLPPGWFDESPEWRGMTTQTVLRIYEALENAGEAHPEVDLLALLRRMNTLGSDPMTVTSAEVQALGTLLHLALDEPADVKPDESLTWQRDLHTAGALRDGRSELEVETELRALQSSLSDDADDAATQPRSAEDQAS